MSDELNFGAWLQGAANFVPTQWALRAQIEYSRILDKSTEVILRRGDTYLAPQLVRVEYDNTIYEEKSDLTDATERRVILFGVRGHPEIDDFNVQVWDSFVMDDGEFTVVSVNRQIIGMIQAHCEVVGV